MLVATALSLVAIFVALHFILQLQTRDGEEEGRLRNALPVYAGALPEMLVTTRVSG